MPASSPSLPAHSAAFLDPQQALHRLPRAPQRQRPGDFYDHYDGLTLFYDCFRLPDGRVLLIGPPPYNLGDTMKRTRFSAWPDGSALAPRFYRSESVMITELKAVPANATAIRASLPDGQSAELPIRANDIDRFAGRRLLFTMSKDNDLAWITEWARYHARVQGADAVVFFDNGSSKYGTEAIAEAIRAGGIDMAAVHCWPYVYGAPDPAIRLNPFYTQFLQVASMSVVLRRHGAYARGLLNCDIDELAATPNGVTIFDLAEQSRQGLVVMEGQFIEPLAEDSARPMFTHRDFRLRHRDEKVRLSRPRKWALDPTRPWVGHLTVHPYMHWINGRPRFSKTQRPDVFYWHFKGITTSWKDQRADTTRLNRLAMEPDPLWAETIGAY